MADLSTLNELEPLGTDDAANGDDEIRATRVAVKTSFAVEHALTGEHAFPSGNAASRPAAGNAGSVYVNTENEWVEFDDGSSMTQLGAVGCFYGSDTPSKAISTYPTYTNIVTPFSVTHRANSRVFVTVSFMGESSGLPMQIWLLVTLGATTLFDTSVSGGVLRLGGAENSGNTWTFVTIPGTNGSSTLTASVATVGGTNTMTDAHVTALVL